MAVSNWQTSLTFVFREEGGFVDDPLDPGGATNLGITLNELIKWRHGAVTQDEIRNLAEAEAGAIYRANYWNVISGNDLPHGIDLLVFDAGVNIGTPRAARFLQQIVGATTDGHIGPLTVAAAAASKAADVIAQFSDRRADFYRSIPTFNHFGAGWLGRTDRARALALHLANAGAPVPQVPIGPAGP